MTTREEIQKAALDATDKKRKCGLSLATGTGKTLVGLMHMERNLTPLMSVLIVAPKLSIFTSWRTEAIKFNKSHLLDNVQFTTYLSLNKLDPREYDMIYFDEAHSLLPSHRDFLDEYDGKILGLTGTPPKMVNSEKGEMMQEFYPICYEYLTDDAINDNILNDYKIIVHQLRLDGYNKNVKAGSKVKQFFTSEEANYQYWCSRIENSRPGKEQQISRVMRMKAMMQFPSKEKYTKILSDNIKSKCIIFANTQEQADELCSHSYHSNNSESDNNLEMFKSGQINKLSCVLQLSEGINIPNLKQCIILHAYGNERKASQRIGRCLRLSVDETATIHILCYMDTIDEKWVTEALSGFDQDKIEWKDFNIKL
jgi:superfamily II DNA or RNA helicase